MAAAQGNMEAGTLARAAPRGVLSVLEVAGDYVGLTKPRIVGLLALTSGASMWLAHGGPPPLRTLIYTLAGVMLAAGGANALNCYVDRDIDAIMARTRRRPLPSGRLEAVEALAFGLASTACAAVLLAWKVSPLTAAVTLGCQLFYVLVYTLWLKRSTPWNIVIGGAAGAGAPLIGWAAATGGLGAPAWLLFAVIFLWTPPHFWALALFRQQEYAAAAVPMLPVVRGPEETRRQILRYAAIVAPVPLLLAALVPVAPWYLPIAGLLGAGFVRNALRLCHEASLAAARRMFRGSVIYLGLLFLAMAAGA